MFILSRFKKRILTESSADKKNLSREKRNKEESPADKESSVNAGKTGREQMNNTATEETEYEIVEKEILPEKMICPDCGGITLVGLDFCDKCGGELINHDN